MAPRHNESNASLMRADYKNRVNLGERGQSQTSLVNDMRRSHKLRNLSEMKIPTVSDGIHAQQSGLHS